jgi:hypothetical protein
MLSLFGSAVRAEESFDENAILGLEPVREFKSKRVFILSEEYQQKKIEEAAALAASNARRPSLPVLRFLKPEGPLYAAEPISLAFVAERDRTNMLNCSEWTNEWFLFSVEEGNKIRTMTYLSNRSSVTAYFRINPVYPGHRVEIKARPWDGRKESAFGEIAWCFQPPFAAVPADGGEFVVTLGETNFSVCVLHDRIGRIVTVKSDSPLPGPGEQDGIRWDFSRLSLPTNSLLCRIHSERAGIAAVECAWDSLSAGGACGSSSDTVRLMIRTATLPPVSLVFPDPPGLSGPENDRTFSFKAVDERQNTIPNPLPVIILSGTRELPVKTEFTQGIYRCLLAGETQVTDIVIRAGDLYAALRLPVPPAPVIPEPAMPEPVIPEPVPVHCDSSYVVQPGDTIWDLAYKFWGDDDWRAFLDCNDIPVKFVRNRQCPVHYLKPGMTLYYPKKRPY